MKFFSRLKAPPSRNCPIPHVTLLGDSILDNAVYVRPGPDVAEQLRARLRNSGTVTNLAVDGYCSRDVLKHVQYVPETSTHIVISCGGNDALHSAAVLEERVTTVAEAVGRLAEVQRQFAQDYTQMLDEVLGIGPPTALCTIYDANHGEPARTVVKTALTLFNDVIIRAAVERDLAVIDLRFICTEPAHYANAIEPSSRGGDKIARAILEFVGGIDAGSTWFK